MKSIFALSLCLLIHIWPLNSSAIENEKAENKEDIQDLNFVAPKVADINNLPGAENGLIVLDTNDNKFKGKDNLGNFIPFGGGVPVGSVLAFAGTTPPPDFMICDGSTLSRTQYSNLFASIGTSFGASDGNTFRIPDLRGYFVRGADNGTGRDPDRNSRTQCATGANSGSAIGTCQSDAYRSHTHSWNNGHNLGTGAYSAHAPGPGSNSPSTSASGGNETRPMNVYLNYIIKIQ